MDFDSQLTQLIEKYQEALDMHFTVFKRSLLQEPWKNSHFRRKRELIIKFKQEAAAIEGEFQTTSGELMRRESFAVYTREHAEGESLEDWLLEPVPRDDVGEPNQ
jgi:hypothetical protein